MCEKQNKPFPLSFNASLKVDFQGSRVTSDGGLILVRELDERLGFGELIERQQKLGKEVVFRADVAFAKPEIYEESPERGVNYAIRPPANESLERDIAELLTWPMGRPSHKPVIRYKSFLAWDSS